ncbi:hypothetical protein DY000_02026129 [Brassica cretica]|uniref:Uncharacterized protein n=1 Tax=Brassica cretica TaxID=69181 RepID=A0ABQ7E8Y4_BRACR|nr:hypothetical protein DY000_02026129 [Brassica cretica]
MLPVTSTRQKEVLKNNPPGSPPTWVGGPLPTRFFSPELKMDLPMDALYGEKCRIYSSGRVTGGGCF